MSDSETAAIVSLQSLLRQRLVDLGMSSSPALENLSRHLAHISVLGNSFAAHTLPLFLSISTEHGDSLKTLAVSLKCDLEELRDALNDIEPDLEELTDLLTRQ